MFFIHALSEILYIFTVSAWHFLGKLFKSEVAKNYYYIVTIQYK